MSAFEQIFYFLNMNELTPCSLNWKKNVDAWIEVIVSGLKDNIIQDNPRPVFNETESSTMEKIIDQIRTSRRNEKSFFALE